jgi:hypothetical protein
MNRMRIAVLGGLALACSAWAQAQEIPPAGSDPFGEDGAANQIQGGEGDGSRNQVEIKQSTFGNSVKDSHSNDLSTNTATSDKGGASAVNGSEAFAYTDNSVGRILEESALSISDLDAYITDNSINVNGEYFTINKIGDYAFHEPKGVTQFAQNSGQNSLLQQNFTISAQMNLPRLISNASDTTAPSATP